MSDTNITKKIKLLHIVEAMGGGVFTYIVSLANQLCIDFEIYIAYATRPQTPINYREYFDDRIHLIEVKNFTRSINCFKDLNAYIELKKISNKVQPDIIHLHSSKAGILGRLAFKTKTILLFYTPHGYSFLMKNYNLLERKLFKRLECIAAKCSCTTISCSKGEYLETLKLTSKAVYINNGIDLVEMTKMLEKLPTEKNSSDTFTIYTLGRICHQKNPKQFNEIAAMLPQYHFLWIGDGELRKELSSPNIEVTGWVSRETGISLAKNADAFLLTSLWEGLPISLLESMYLKKPCVVTDVIGNRDVIRNGVNGFISNNSTKLVSFIQTICDNPQDINEVLTHNAYQDILNEFNVAVMAKRYAQLYQNAISDGVAKE